MLNFSYTIHWVIMKNKTINNIEKESGLLAKYDKKCWTSKAEGQFYMTFEDPIFSYLTFYIFLISNEIVKTNLDNSTLLWSPAFKANQYRKAC